MYNRIGKLAVRLLIAIVKRRADRLPRLPLMRSEDNMRFDSMYLLKRSADALAEVGRNKTKYRDRPRMVGEAEYGGEC